MVTLASRAGRVVTPRTGARAPRSRFVTIKDSWRPAPAQDMASELFGVAGLRVTEVERGPDGTLEVWAVTDHPAAGACPDCGRRPGGRMSGCWPGRGMCAAARMRWR